jgi:hypothetical protein
MTLALLTHVGHWLNDHRRCRNVRLGEREDGQGDDTGEEHVEGIYMGKTECSIDLPLLYTMWALRARYCWVEMTDEPGKRAAIMLCTLA